MPEPDTPAAGGLWPVPPGVRGVLLVGGTFDPPHKGHTRVAAACRDAVLGPRAWVVYVPAARSPAKRSAPIASPEDRVAMLRAATAGDSAAAIWEEELRRGGPSFWVETLAAARDRAGPAADLRFLIGTDQAAEFHRWRDPRRILALARPVVAPRGAISNAAELSAALSQAGCWSPSDLASWRDAMAPVPRFDASASEVRALLPRADAAARARLAALVDPGVLAYIRARGLYGSPARAGLIEHNPVMRPEMPRGGLEPPTSGL